MKEKLLERKKEWDGDKKKGRLNAVGRGPANIKVENNNKLPLYYTQISINWHGPVSLFRIIEKQKNK